MWSTFKKKKFELLKIVMVKKKILFYLLLKTLRLYHKVYFCFLYNSENKVIIF